METKELEFLHDYKAGKIKTYSGVEIDLKNPKPDDIKIHDIAHALSNVCRFGGHTKEFYSVALHSVLVTKISPIDIAKEALLHDAAEAYLGDVVKPLKHLLPEYDSIESNFMKAISEKFGLNAQKLNEVKKYDLIALEIEYQIYVKGKVELLRNIEAVYGLCYTGNRGRNHIPNTANNQDYDIFLQTFEVITSNN